MGSIWYEQTVEQRARAMRWYADRNDECVAAQRACLSSCVYQMDRHGAQAVRLRVLADKMEQTGRVLA